MYSDSLNLTVLPISFSNTNYVTVFGGQGEMNTATDSAWGMLIKTSTKTSSQFQAISVLRNIYVSTLCNCIAIGF